MPERIIWPLTRDTFQALGLKYVPAMEAAVAHSEVKSRDWYWLLSALTFEPQPVTAERLAIRHPYIANQQYQASLQNLAQEGLLAAVDEGAYRLTEAGRDLVQRIIQSAYAALDVLQPLPQPELVALAALLEQAVNSCLQASEPENKASLGYSRKLDPGPGAPVMVRIDQFLTDLSAFRDDAHLASWAQMDVTSAAWEALTHIWRDKKLGLDEIRARFERRGFERAACLAALNQLEARGWVEAVSEAYILTSLGSKVRQVAERETDRLFHQPFYTFSPKEWAELERSLSRLRDQLKA